MNTPNPLLPSAPKRTLAEIKYLCDLATYQRKQDKSRRDIAERVAELERESSWDKGAELQSELENSEAETAAIENLLVQIEDGLQTIVNIKTQLGLEAIAEESALAAIKDFFSKKLS